MQAELVRIGAQGRRGFLGPAGHGAQAQHLLSGARPQRDAIGAYSPSFYSAGGPDSTPADSY